MRIIHCIVCTKSGLQDTWSRFWSTADWSMRDLVRKLYPTPVKHRPSWSEAELVTVSIWGVSTRIRFHLCLLNERVPAVLVA